MSQLSQLINRGLVQNPYHFQNQKQLHNPINFIMTRINSLFYPITILLSLTSIMYGLSYNHWQQPTKPKIQHPVLLAYISRINNWWPPQKIAASLGVPEYGDPHIYNYIALAFWTYQSGPLDIVMLWADPVKYFGTDSVFGKSKEQIQNNIRAKYNQYGIKLLISAFGATQFPTSANVNPNDCAVKLGNFVKQNNLDGVDIDWEDNAAMEAGKGEEWLCTFTQKLRQIIPNHIITHAPQAPYFCQQHYKNGAYMTVNNKVGNLIDFYNVQFYNQGNNAYDTYDTLFIQSKGNFLKTSVKQIAQRGVPLNKIIVGKPVVQSDATNTGWMQKTVLGNAVNRANKQGKWCGGVMFWQFVSDVGGQTVQSVAGQLKNNCQNKADY